jgi:hypothetical protein
MEKKRQRSDQLKPLEQLGQQEKISAEHIDLSVGNDPVRIDIFNTKSAQVAWKHFIGDYLNARANLRKSFDIKI